MQVFGLTFVIALLSAGLVINLTVLLYILLRSLRSLGRSSTPEKDQPVFGLASVLR